MLTVPYEVKKALKQGRKKKEYKFKVYSGGELQFTIDNDNLISESVKIDERMCSGDEIKFGLCEGSSLEFQYFGFDNIRGCEIEAILSVEYDNDGESAYYDIPMGWFTVDQCPKQFSTGIYKVTAYNKLKSEYLDTDIKNEALSLIKTGTPGHSNELPVNILLNELLNGYGILTNYESTNVIFSDIPTWSTPSITTGNTIYPQDQSVYSSLHFYVYSSAFCISIDNLSLDNIYNISLKVKALRDYCYQRYKSYFDDCYIDSGKTTSLWDYVLGGQTGNAFIYTDGSIYIENQQWYDNVIIDDIFTSTDDVVSKLYTNIKEDISYECSIMLRVPILMKTSSESIIPPWTNNELTLAHAEVLADLQSMGYVTISRLDSVIGNYRLTTSNMENISSLTCRELQSAVYEIDAQYGHLDRETDLFSGVELNGGGLYPSTTLYPGTSLYPNTNIVNGDNLHPFPSEYQKLWTDTVGEQSFRYLIITYKGLDENNQEKEFTLQRTVNANGTTDYIMSDNWLFKNLIWTESDVGDYADAMVAKMQDIKWFPFEMWAAGLPYVETGDAIEITDKEGDTYVSYILQRQLNGIQNLQDTYINGELDIF